MVYGLNLKDNNYRKNNSSNNKYQDWKTLEPTIFCLQQWTQNNFVRDIWICDIVPCGHYCNFMNGLPDTRDIDETITIEDGDLI
jgi:hypothetical protein